MRPGAYAHVQYCMLPGMYSTAFCLACTVLHAAWHVQYCMLPGMADEPMRDGHGQLVLRKLCMQVRGNAGMPNTVHAPCNLLDGSPTTLTQPYTHTNAMHRISLPSSTHPYKHHAAPQAALPQQPVRRREHEFALRGGITDLKAEYDALRPSMALTFPFELDVFQKEAVVHMEAGRWAAGGGGAVQGAVQGAAVWQGMTG
jgi:hypothetical protein